MDKVAVIMAGGAGTRLWPMSRQDKPKQFLNLSGTGTLLEETIKRLQGLDLSRVVVVTSTLYEELTRQELEKFNLDYEVLCEPMARNTAAAVLYAAHYCNRAFDDSLMLVLPADHYITDVEGFEQVMNTALETASQGSLVTMGITPEYAETGYGYIKCSGNGQVRQVDQFVEKPDTATAEQYLASGDYLWNSGMFAWKTSRIMKEFEKHMPAHVSAFTPMASWPVEDIASMDSEQVNAREEIFNSVDKVSIDVGVLEKTEDIKVIPGEFGWKDLGSWKSVDDILIPDQQDNRSPNKDRVLFHNTTGCSVFAETSNVAVIGTDNLVVVQSGNDILVINKDMSQDAKEAALHFISKASSPG